MKILYPERKKRAGQPGVCQRRKIVLPGILLTAVAQLLVFGCSKQNTPVENDYAELTWWDLLSAEEEVFYESYDPYEADENTEFPPPLPNENLDGKLVKIPGYMVNLDGDFDMTSNFLLVPVAGSCVHVPPPPENQIVFVESPEPVDFDLYIPVWVYGTVSVSGFANEYADGLYTLAADKVEPYPIE